MRRDHEEFAKLETEILSIAPEDHETVRSYWKKERLPFVGLADPEHAVADRYGQAVRLLRLGRLPLQLVVGKAGTVRFRHDARSMSDIPSNAAVLEAISQSDPP